ncbi:MAG: biotin transporter BioY [Phycisphaerales bacterium]
MTTASQTPALNPAASPYPSLSGDLRAAGLALAGSWLLALSAQVSFSIMPISPVPITAQSLAVLMLGVLLGPRLGGAAILAYLVQGAAGLPFFAGGAGGAHYLFGAASAGYLWAFLPAGVFVGLMHERGWTRSVWSAAGVFTIGTAIILLGGTMWLAAYFAWLAPEAPSGTLLMLGVVPFIPGAIVKIALACAFLPRPTRSE